MYKEKNNIDQLITEFLEHSISPKDMQTLQEWTNLSKKNREYLISCQKLQLVLSLKRREKYQSDIAYKHFIQKQKNTNATRYSRYTQFKKYVGYAAAILFCILIGKLYEQKNHKIDIPIKEFIVNVPNGGQTILCLPDSTEIWLNAGSTFKYTSDYGIKNRNVSLQGEAFFNVRKNTQQPFTVQTDSVSVKVYGTKFSVRNFSDIETVKVALQEGKVALELNTINDTLFMSPLQEVSYKKQEAVYSIKKVDYNIADWRNGYIRFDMETLDEIIHVLQRQYNVSIQIENPKYLEKKFYGSFKTNQSIHEVMDIICSGMNIQYSHTNNTYIIH